jgi:hypothetical protein
VTNAEQLIAFYKGDAPDHRGRLIEEIWQMSDFWLEHTHDYVQWLFPIPEAGRFNGFAPLLDVTAIKAFQEDQALQERQRQSLDMMLDFLALQRTEGGIRAKPELNMRDHIWLKAGGHNHLRITRMIRSLGLCGQRNLALQLQAAVIQIGTEKGHVSSQSKAYWRSALE